MFMNDIVIDVSVVHVSAGIVLLTMLFVSFVCDSCGQSLALFLSLTVYNGEYQGIVGGSGVARDEIKVTCNILSNSAASHSSLRYVTILVQPNTISLVNTYTLIG